MVFSKARYKDDYFTYNSDDGYIYYLDYNQYANNTCSNIEIELQIVHDNDIDEILDAKRIVFYDTCNDSWDSFISKHEDDNLTDSEMDALYKDEYKDIIFEDVIEILSSYCY